MKKIIVFKVNGEDVSMPVDNYGKKEVISAVETKFPISEVNFITGNSVEATIEVDGLKLKIKFGLLLSSE